jgi:hypothetical protein
VRLCLIVPHSPRHVVSLAVVKTVAIDEIIAEGNEVIDLGAADPRLGDGVEIWRDLLPVWGAGEELLAEIRTLLAQDDTAISVDVPPQSTGGRQ